MTSTISSNLISSSPSCTFLLEVKGEAFIPAFLSSRNVSLTAVGVEWRGRRRGSSSLRKKERGVRRGEGGAMIGFENGSMAGIPVIIRAPGALTKSKTKRRNTVEVQALDAAMPFDYEAIQKRQLKSVNRLKIGIVGFGNFGQFLARRILGQNHSVIALSRTDYSTEAREMGVTYFRDADDFCEEHPDVVILATSILSTDKVLKSLPLQRLKRNTLFVDVLSVKEFPKNLFLQVLPRNFDILCTHPMFGPESGKGSWEGLPFVYDKVRICPTQQNQDRCNRVLQIFEKEGCRMVDMACEEHDKYAAGSQFVTHTVGRVLGKLKLESTPINTRGYETLLNLVENTSGDSFDLYYGLFMYNVNATEELNNLERAFDEVKKHLFDQLHDVLRSQLFDTNKKEGKSSERPTALLTSSQSSSSEVVRETTKLIGGGREKETAERRREREGEVGNGANVSFGGDGMGSQKE